MRIALLSYRSKTHCDGRGRVTMEEPYEAHRRGDLDIGKCLDGLDLC